MASRACHLTYKVTRSQTYMASQKPPGKAATTPFSQLFYFCLTWIRNTGFVKERAWAHVTRTVSHISSHVCTYNICICYAMRVDRVNRNTTCFGGAGRQMTVVK